VFGQKPIALDHQLVALAQELIALAKSDIALSKILVAFCECDIPLAQELVALPDGPVAPMQMSIALRRQDIDSKSDFLEFEPQLCARTKATKTFEHLHEHSHTARHHVAAAA
jgi:hypothetical protein